MVVDVKKWLGGNVAEAIIRTVVAASMLMCLILFIRQGQLASCQAKYDQAYALYAKETRENQQKVNEARDTFFMAFHEALLRKDSKTLDDVNRAFDRYFATVEEFKKRQVEHPPPELPEKTCGG